MYPGADPKLQGYFAKRAGRPRKAPDWHDGHDENFKTEFLNGYDDE